MLFFVGINTFQRIGEDKQLAGREQAGRQEVGRPLNEYMFVITNVSVGSHSLIHIRQGNCW